MSSSLISSLEKDIARLEADIEYTIKFLKKLEQKRSDSLYYLKLLEQNVKYMKRKNAITSASHYNKTIKSQKAMEKELKQLNEQIDSISTSLRKAGYILNVLKSDLTKLKEKMTAKVIPFRKKK